MMHLRIMLKLIKFFLKQTWPLSAT